MQNKIFAISKDQPLRNVMRQVRIKKQELGAERFVKITHQREYYGEILDHSRFYYFEMLGIRNERRNL